MSTHYQVPQDAVWFITGCSSGIGQALASYILKNTTNRVVATARTISSLEPLPSGLNLLKLELDVTSQTSIQEAISNALKNFGRIDVFVNNAGYGLFGDTESATDEMARKQLDTNFWGAVDVTKAALPVLREENAKNGGQKGGVVVQVSSMGGRMGFVGNAYYAASKFALEGFTECVAKEMPPDWNIHFLILEPGGVKTNYAGSSLVHIPPHPSYTDPSFPTNQLKAYMANPESTDDWADAHVVAEIMYSTIKNGIEGVNRGKGGIPLRLPLGAESFMFQKMAHEEALRELEMLEKTSLSTNPNRNLDSLEFLKK
ncbi:short-chain dehydrogenase [Delitschia confertaspora ATCC 74209]|uniref:Short-chain dehydrogenase n=1 Tax=Delitschia confertaspora ATCC 74209 TaxID=1513339 RepID=A0A9P4JU52_9PLEO|nr:short-chain dehydrogenase [Delitschia confertaspora ATCC 74209]